MDAATPTRADASPLLLATPARWTREVLAQPLELLNDHAHLEKKAATNALELLQRWPDPDPPPRWVGVLARVAREETEHLARVHALLERRGGALSKTHTNAYAHDLRRGVRLGAGRAELVDRLLVAALIEARSAERFALLSRATDPELAELYANLAACERGHHRAFVDLALQVLPEAGARWDELLELEARVARAQAPGPRLHAWVAQ